MPTRNLHLTPQQEAQSGIAYDLISPQAQALRSGAPPPAPQVPQAPSNINGISPEMQALLDELKKQLDEMKKRGQVLNPNIEITPEKMAEFTAQAQREIDPYYSSQLRLAREGMLRDFGYAQEQILQNEKQLEQKYGLQTRQLGESAAEKGFALSGGRQLEEQQLAQETQQNIDQNRRQLNFQAGTAARNFAQQYGPSQLETPQFQSAPRVLPGQGTFQRQGGTTPFYELSPETYQGLVGTKQFEQRGAVRGRASELEEAFRRQQAIKQARSLN